MNDLTIALVGDAVPETVEAAPDYRNEIPSRDGFVAAWPPQRYWKSASEDHDPAGKPLHLYFHIPFCLQRCRYCFFKIEILSESSHAVRERYVSALCREVEQVADSHRLRGRTVKSIYFGGGTPSVIQPEQLARIKRTIEACFRLDDPEFVFEFEPITLNNRMIDGLADLGVNRISFGIQSFDDRVVALTGRHDTEEKNAKAIERALKTGAVVNIDLLSGLEGETTESWQHSINRAIDLGVHAVTVYKLELYWNAHYMSDIRQGKLSLPGADQEIAFARWGLARGFATAAICPPRTSPSPVAANIPSATSPVAGAARTCTVSGRRHSVRSLAIPGRISAKSIRILSGSRADSARRSGRWRSAAPITCCAILSWA